MFLSTSDTMCSLATRPGGVIGVIRVSGEKAIEVADKISHGVRGRYLTDVKGNTLHYGEIFDKEGNTIDGVLISVFCAPHSYAGGNSTEISCHGSIYILNRVVKALTNVGCRQAQLGEYTRRACLSGKMDLSQAEAVASLIVALNRATRQVTLSQLKGHFSSELPLLCEQFLKMTSLLELGLDSSNHEELEFADHTELKVLAETTH